MMTSPNELQHHSAYNAQQAHEYYMRTRKLHPRERSARYTVVSAHGTTAHYTAKELAQQKIYAARRVERAKTRLHKLNTELKERLAAARKREADAKKAPTASDKTKTAQESKKYRQSHKQELQTKAKEQREKTKTLAGHTTGGSSSSTKSTSSSSSTKTETVADVKKEIVTAKTTLQAAIARQRSLATAKKSG